MKQVVIAFLLLLAPALHSQIDTIWIADDGERIKNTFKNHWAKQENPLTNTVFYNDTVHLYAARNETVAFQVMIQGGSSGASNVNVTLDSLSKPAGETDAYTIKNYGNLNDPFDYVGKYIEFFVEHYMSIASASPFFGGTNFNTAERTRLTYAWFSGSRPVDQYLSDTIYTGTNAIPEPLVPFQASPGSKAHGQGGAPFSVTANKLQGVWCDVYVHRDSAKAGDYHGSLKIYYNTSTLRKTIPVRLHVWNWAIPDTSNTHVSATIQNDIVASRHTQIYGSDGNWALVRKYQALLRRHGVVGFPQPTVHTITNNADTTIWSQQQAQIFNGDYFSADSGYDGRGQDTPPNYMLIGGYDQPTHMPQFNKTTSPPSNTGWDDISTANFLTTKANAAGVAWSSSTVSYAINDIVRYTIYPYFYYCVVAHTSSASRIPGASGGAAYWAPIYDKGNLYGFSFDPDSTTRRGYYRAGADFWMRFRNTYNPTAWIEKYGHEEVNVEDAIRDTSSFADMRQKIRWLDTNPSTRILDFRIATRFDPSLTDQHRMNMMADVLSTITSQENSHFTDSVNAYMGRGKKIGLYTDITRPMLGGSMIDAPATDYRIPWWAMWKYDTSATKTKFARLTIWYTLNFKDGSATQINPWDRDRNLIASTPVGKWDASTSYTTNQIVEYTTYPHRFKAKKAVPAGQAAPTTSASDPYWSADYPKTGFGTGTLLYPGQDAKYPSDSRGLEGAIAGIRLKNLRRGILDREYLYIANALGIDVTPYVNSVVGGAFEFAGNPLSTPFPPWDADIYHARKYENARIALGYAIEAALPAVTPPGATTPYRWLQGWR